MNLELSRAAIVHLEILDHATSTNDELAARAAGLGDLAVLVTTDQRAGRGRLGREWVAPRGTSLATSILLRPTLPAGEPLGLDRFGWLPLIAGLAMARTVASLIPSGDDRVSVKWPNDVLVEGRKIAGLLGELLPTGDGVVMGAGLNLGMTREQLPIATATSLVLEGAILEGDELVDEALSRYFAHLSALYREFLRVGADADASGVRAALRDSCSTLGLEVRVHLPGGDELLGTATDIDSQGRLMVRRSSDGNSLAVAAGDVVHVRYE